MSIRKVKMATAMRHCSMHLNVGFSSVFSKSRNSCTVKSYVGTLGVLSFYSIVKSINLIGTCLKIL